MNEKQKLTYLFAFLIGLGFSCFVLGINQANYSNYEYPTGKTYSISGVRKQESGKSGTQLLDNGTGNRTGNLYGNGQTISGGNGDNQEKYQTGHKPVLRVKGFDYDTDATKIINYAYKISGGDMDFILTLKAENGGFNMYQQSNVVTNGKREESYGLCQLMKKRHPEVNTKEFRESWEYQVDVCWRKYKGGTKFYGYNVRNRYKNQFYWE